MNPSLLLTALVYACVARVAFAAAPQPFGAVPSERQLRWHETETYSLVHFGLNTYTDREGGYGNEDPALFNPKAPDANQVAATLKRGGMNGMILVAKHHDGFCLWPTKTTPHNLARSPWRGGRGDLVREYADAAKKHGLRFGISCSPWDRNAAAYGTPDYPPLYQAQLRELLANYGTLFEVRFDGDGGGDGYYGGAREKRAIDRLTYYDWPKIWELVRQLQPAACIFGDAGPDVRRSVGDSTSPSEATPGHRDGQAWIPAERTLPLRKGWFWHPNEDATVRTPANLMAFYFESVGKGGCMSLGVAPDRSGLVGEADIRSLEAFGNLLRTLFAANYADGAVVSASQVRAWAAEPGKPNPYAPENVRDGDRYSYWATDDAVTNATLTLTLPAVTEFNVVRLRENIRLGRRVGGFAVETWQEGAWKEYAAGQGIGACRLLRGEKIKTDRVRLRITGADACPCISDVGLFSTPPALDQK